MRDDHIDLCGQVDFTRTEAMPLLARDEAFSFACADAATAAGGGRISCCRALTCGASQPGCVCRPRPWPGPSAGRSIGQVSHLPVLRLAP